MKTDIAISCMSDLSVRLAGVMRLISYRSPISGFGILLTLNFYKDNIYRWVFIATLIKSEKQVQSVFILFLNFSLQSYTSESLFLASGKCFSLYVHNLHYYIICCTVKFLLWKVSVFIPYIIYARVAVSN